MDAEEMTSRATPPQSHTPGPWHHVEEDNLILITTTAGRHVCDFQPVSTHVSVAERNANGRLITAAPDLLNALERALRDSGCDGDLCMHEWHEDARKAISKAREGE